jgi:cellulose synthase/poly-beta-1,6-N-acetylglucosamine synthase-like glycosyltransferase
LEQREAKTHIGVVIAARNEELYIEKTLQHLLNQTLKPSEIVVVDDGSTDKTAEIAKKYNTLVISLHDRGYGVVGSPILLKVRNVGFEVLNSKGELDYVLVLDADTILPKTYLETIISRMERNPSLVIASGRFSSETSYPDAPTESGRIYRFKFMRDIGFFPINYAGEDYPLFKALKMGYKIRCFEDVVTWQQRALKLSGKKLYYLGKGMRALGYNSLYFLGKFVFMFLKSPKGAVGMLSGYISSDIQKYQDLKDFTKKWQRQELVERLRKLLTLKKR